MTTVSQAQDDAMATERRRDVLLLLENMARREDATVRLILDCLYDIGTVHLINDRVRSRPLNRTLRHLSRTSKPVFREVATHLFHKSCPTLIADWLYSRATFQPPQLPTEVSAAVIVNAQALDADREVLPSLISDRIQIEQALEIAHLRQRVKRLTTLLVGSLALAGGLGAGLGYTLRVLSLDQAPPSTLPTAIEVTVD